MGATKVVTRGPQSDTSVPMLHSCFITSLVSVGQLSTLSLLVLFPFFLSFPVRKRISLCTNRLSDEE